MKRTLALALAIAVGLPLFAGGADKAAEVKKPAAAASKVDLSKPRDKASYALGASFAMNLKTTKYDFNFDMILKGFQDSLTEGGLALSSQEIMQAVSELQKEVSNEIQKQRLLDANKNKEDGDKFLAENKKNKGVIVTGSGLQYIVVKEGKGKTPKGTDKVKVAYEGKLIDGTVFDFSKPDEPVSFPVNEVIPGWQEALLLMKEGEKAKLFLPANLAYGATGAGAKIGPNAVLIFEIELLEVLPPDVTAPAAPAGPGEPSAPASAPAGKVQEK